MFLDFEFILFISMFAMIGQWSENNVSRSTWKYLTLSKRSDDYQKLLKTAYFKITAAFLSFIKPY